MNGVDGAAARDGRGGDHPDPVPSCRTILRLAVPALGVLAAEPLYVLVDTAVVGHLGAVPLAGLALGGAVLSLATLIGSFLAYGTTGRAARLHGAGRRAEAVTEGVQASWLAMAIGLLFVGLAQPLAGPLVGIIGGGSDAGVTAAAVQWLRIAAFGAPGILLALAGNGWMRGVQQTRRPLAYVLAGNGASAVLCPVLVYGPGPLPALGLVGSATANLAAQSVVGGLFTVALLTERVPLRPVPAILAGQLRVGRDLVIRTVSIQASFLSAAAVASRFGPAVLAPCSVLE